MEYCCLKTGFELLDSVHAMGLGLLLWSASRQPVTLEDRGLDYLVTTETPIELLDLSTILAYLLPLTTPAELNADTKCVKRDTYVLDGALTWLSTSPGPRVVSVAAVRRNSFRNPNIAEAAISKWSRLRTKVLSLAQRMDKRFGLAADRMLAGYTAHAPQPISFGPKPSNGISIPLVLEPALGFAYRHPFPDGAVSEKANVAVLSPPLTPILLLLGGVYCLRSQEVAGRLVHIYGPIIRQATIDGDPIMPCLPTTDSSSDEALMGVWLKMQRGHLASNSIWTSLTYQILQTQGAQQSFSLGRGALNLNQPATASPAQLQLYRCWFAWLLMPRKQRPPGIDELISAVLRREPGAFSAHLELTALAGIRAMYGEDEVYEAVTMTDATDRISTTLIAIMDHPQGTYRFGTALRGLGEYLPAVQRDLIADLDIVRDRDQLLRVLARVAEQCVISAAKNPFAVVPNDDDLRGLLADVEQHGAHTIAGLIIILAALRYPRRVEAESALITPNQDITEAL